MMFGQPQASPAMFGGQQMNPQLLQMLLQRMQQGGAPQPPQPQMQGQQPQMPPGGMNPVNVPQQGPMPPMAPGGTPQMNPLASILGNQGGAMSSQGGLDNGSAGQGNGMGGLTQIINAMKSQQQVNGSQPQAGPGGMNIMAIIKAMQGG